MADPNFNIFGNRMNPNQWAINVGHYILRRRRQERGFNNLPINQQVRIAAGAVASGVILSASQIKRLGTYFIQGGLQQLSRLAPTNTDTSEIAVDPTGDFTTPDRTRKPIEPNMSGRAKKRLRMDSEDEERRISTGEEGTMEVFKAEGQSGAAHQFKNGETAVDNIPVTRYTPFDKTQQVMMPYYVHQVGLSISSGNQSGAVHTKSFRLNSIYDVETGTTYTADPTPAADSADGTVNTPSMRNYWTQLYRKWTVVGCRYHIRFRPNDYLKYTDAQYSIYVYEHGDQAIPKVNTASTPKVIQDLYRKYHPHIVAHKYVNSNDRYNQIVTGTGVYNGGPGNAGDGNAADVYMTLPNGQHDWVSIHKGTYHKGSIEHAVVEDELAQTWHNVDEVPPTREIMTCIVQRSDTSDTGQSLNFELEFSIEYIVQLKDLKADFEYLHDTTDFPAITDFAAQSN
jgi:hypothetical protein